MINTAEIVKLLHKRDFTKLFVEHLLWDRTPNYQAIEIEGLKIQSHAQKKNFVICSIDLEKNHPPPLDARKKIVNKLGERYRENILIFHNEKKQTWLTKARASTDNGDRERIYEETWYSHQTPQMLLSKVRKLMFALDQEENIRLTEVIHKVNAAFIQNSERITKQFYEKLKQKLNEFEKFIQGIAKKQDKYNYAVLMLNRLMFIYFIQKKGFLDNNTNYLPNKLKDSQSIYGKDKFMNKFYRNFLLKLFHYGLRLPEKEREDDIKDIIGNIPYLNGGLFDIHQIEEQDEARIDISDEAFEKLFTFFDEYNWYLDSRPDSTGRDINPDVLGYIFEKFINERAELGAYYTPEDVSSYIAGSTILPQLLRKVRERCEVAFEDSAIWKLLKDEPDRYIWEEIRYGCDNPDENLPNDISTGLDPTNRDLVKLRRTWNNPTPSEWGLENETWRETLGRRAHYKKVKKKIQKGEVTNPQTMVALNLNIHGFIIDAIKNYEGSEKDYEGSDFIAAMFSAITGFDKGKEQEVSGITILDPACGSGAFLFAALNVLEPLYEACIERMRSFVDDDNKKNEKGDNPKYMEFRSILKKIDQRSNQRYWIYRTIILNNLFGVDIMPGAVETAKLRLFLKLAAEAEVDLDEENLGLDPLPDIDFNIRVGNSLIGFTNLKEIEKTKDLASNEELIKEISQLADRIDTLYKKFILKQEVTDGLRELHHGKEKKELSSALDILSDKLNNLLAQNNGTLQQDEDKARSSNYVAWKEETKPFHWWSGFHNILQSGGFDVVIGNPPYKGGVSYQKQEPEVRLYKTTKCNNLYGFFIERCVKLGYQGLGMVVPISFPSTPQMSSVREQLTSSEANLYLSHFAIRPGKLFQQVDQSITIFLAHKEAKGVFYSTHYNYWSTQEREFLFHRLAYCSDNSQRKQEIWGKIGSSLQKSVIEKVSKQNSDLYDYQVNKKSERSKQKMFAYNSSALRYWGKFLLSYAPSDGYKKIYFHSPKHAAALMAVMSSSLFFNCWTVFSDGRDVRNLDLKKLRINKKAFEKDLSKLAKLGKTLNTDIKKNRKQINSKQAEFSYHPKYSKKIIDQIDTLIAKHYDLTPEELDYVINYFYKYRMGKEES